MRNDSLLTRDAVRWLACLPFLGVHDFALLTGQPEPDVEGVLREIKQDGLVDAVRPSSPELEGAPLYVLTEPTRRWLRSTLDAAAARTLPLAWRDIVYGLARLEATVALNAFAAGLAASLHSADREVSDFHVVPVRRPQDAWWPPGVQGYGCIRAVAGAAPFFVFVDRPGVPSAHRAALIAGWYRFRDSGQPWGYDIPPILVLCPGQAREGEWARAMLASAERRDAVPLRVLLTSVVAGTDGFGLRTWQPVAGRGRAALMEWLPVRHSDHLALSLAPLPDLLPPAPDEERQPLHRWARAVATGAREATTVERAAAVALTTSMVEKELIECLAHHPLLSEADLATVLDRDHRMVRSAIEHATTQGLTAYIDRSDDRCRRYCLASAGLRTLALRDGVPVRRYARHAPVTVLTAEGERVPTLLQQHEHTVGANSFFIAWLEGPPGGPYLLSWLSAAESAIRFESGGRRRWLRPDGAGAVLANGVRHQFLFEWDRGTERLPVIASKLARYAEFFQTPRNHGDGSPALLLVTTTPHREELMRRIGVATIGSSSDQLMTTTAPLLDRYGPFGAVWRGHAGQARTRWPGAATDHDYPLEVRR
jgi:hypothetical protein